MIEYNQKNNSYSYEIYCYDGIPIEKKVCAINLVDALNEIDSIYDLADPNFKGLNIEMLRKGD